MARARSPGAPNLNNANVTRFKFLITDTKGVNLKQRHICCVAQETIFEYTNRNFSARAEEIHCYIVCLDAAAAAALLIFPLADTEASFVFTYSHFMNQSKGFEKKQRIKNH